jgi:hypothetical protein
VISVRRFNIECVVFIIFQCFRECANDIIMIYIIAILKPHRKTTTTHIEKRLLYLDFKRENASVAKFPSIINEFFASLSLSRLKRTQIFPAAPISIDRSRLRNHNAERLNEKSLKHFSALFRREKFDFVTTFL